MSVLRVLAMALVLALIGAVWSTWRTPVDDCPADPELLVCAEVWDLWTPGGSP